MITLIYLGWFWSVYFGGRVSEKVWREGQNDATRWRAITLRQGLCVRFNQWQCFKKTTYTEVRINNQFRPPTVEEKIVLSQNIYKVANKDLGAIVNILEEHCPKALDRVRGLRLNSLAVFATTYLSELSWRSRHHHRLDWSKNISYYRKAYQRNGVTRISTNSGQSISL